MALRINPDPTINLLAALERTRRQEDRAVAQLASGRRVNTLSDDTPAAVAALRNRIQVGETDQFLRNVSSLRGLVETTENALNEVVLALTQAITLGVQGGNGTLSPENRLSIADEVRGIERQVLSLANLSFQGNYVFAGTEVKTPPFTSDAASPSGVRYDGNSSVNQAEIAPGQTVTPQLAGDRVFAKPGTDVFLALKNLASALETGEGVDTATVALRRAFDHVTAQRAFFGNALSTLETTESFLHREKVVLLQRENDLIGADLPQTATDLVQANQAREAVLAAGGRISQLNLIDYLR